MKGVLCPNVKFVFHMFIFLLLLDRFFYFVLVFYQVLIRQNNTFLYFHDENISGSIIHVSVQIGVLVVHIVVLGHR